MTDFDDTPDNEALVGTLAPAAPVVATKRQQSPLSSRPPRRSAEELYERACHEFDDAARKASFLSGWRTAGFAVFTGASVAVAAATLLPALPATAVLASFGAGVGAVAAVHRMLHAEQLEKRDRMEMYARRVEDEARMLAAGTDRADRLETKLALLATGNTARVRATLRSIVGEASPLDAELRAAALLDAYSNNQLDALQREVFAALASLYGLAGVSRAGVRASFGGASFGGIQGVAIPTFSPLTLTNVRLGLGALKGFEGGVLRVNDATTFLDDALESSPVNLGAPGPNTDLRIRGLRSEHGAAIVGWAMESGRLVIEGAAGSVGLKTVVGDVEIECTGPVVMSKCKLTGPPTSEGERLVNVGAHVRRRIASPRIILTDGQYCATEFSGPRFDVLHTASFSDCVLPAKVLVHGKVTLDKCAGPNGTRFPDGDHVNDGEDPALIVEAE